MHTRGRVSLVAWLVVASPAFAVPGDGDNFSEPSSTSSSSSSSSSTDFGSPSSGTGNADPRLFAAAVAATFVFMAGTVVVRAGPQALIKAAQGDMSPLNRALNPDSVADFVAEGDQGVTVYVDGKRQFDVYAEDAPKAYLVNKNGAEVRVLAAPVLGDLGRARMVPLRAGMTVRVRADGAVWFRHGTASWTEAPLAGGAQADPFAGVRARDGAFDPEAFDAFVREAVRGVYLAWNAGRAEDLRPWTSDGVYNRFATQIAIHAARGRRNEARDFAIRRVVPLSSTLGAAYDAIDVEIGLFANDVDVEIATGANTAPPKALEFTEIWTFVRRADALTRPGAAGCPGCGSPLGDGAVIRCPACSALVNSGESRWVLTEITQPKARLAKPALQLPEGVSAAVLEDRASACFWAWIAAGLGLGDTLRVIGVTPFPRAPTPYDDVGVGAVVLREVAAEGAALIARVEVRWTGTLRSTGTRSTQTWAVLLRREAGGAVDKRGLATLACATCAGPCGRTDEPTCAFCGARRGPSPSDWVGSGLVES